MSISFFSSRHQSILRPRVIALIVCLTFPVVAAGCASLYEIPVETPMPATLDLSPFTHVLVAGFIAAGTEEIDANVETVRLLRSQLRTRSALRLVGGADVLPLLEIAAQTRSDARPPGLMPAGMTAAPFRGSVNIPKTEPELETYAHIFSDVGFWKRIGEEYQHPAIITGTVLFTAGHQTNVVQRDRDVLDGFGRRRVESRREFVPRTVYTLKAKFIFIDGRSGTIMFSESSEEALSTEVSRELALSAYFQLIDRIAPTVLATLSNHNVRGFRTLMK